MVLGVRAWALGHLVGKSSPPALMLFGGFLVWAVVNFISLRMRRGVAVEAPATVLNTAGTVILGVALFVAFAIYGHLLLIGVRPFD